MVFILCIRLYANLRITECIFVFEVCDGLQYKVSLIQYLAILDKKQGCRGG